MTACNCRLWQWPGRHQQLRNQHSRPQSIPDCHRYRHLPGPGQKDHPVYGWRGRQLRIHQCSGCQEVRAEPPDHWQLSYQDLCSSNEMLFSLLTLSYNRGCSCPALSSSCIQQHICNRHTASCNMNIRVEMVSYLRMSRPVQHASNVNRSTEL